MGSKRTYKDHIEDKPLPRCRECQSTKFTVVGTQRFDYEAESEACIRYDQVRWQRVRCCNCGFVCILRSYLYKGDQVEGESIADEQDDANLSSE